MQKLKVAVVGGGGRENAIVLKLKESKKIEKLYCIPGNAGIYKKAKTAGLTCGFCNKKRGEK